MNAPQRPDSLSARDEELLIEYLTDHWPEVWYAMTGHAYRRAKLFRGMLEIAGGRGLSGAEIVYVWWARTGEWLTVRKFDNAMFHPEFRGPERTDRTIVNIRGVYALLGYVAWRRSP